MIVDVSKYVQKQVVIEKEGKQINYLDVDKHAKEFEKIPENYNGVIARGFATQEEVSKESKLGLHVPLTGKFINYPE